MSKLQAKALKILGKVNSHYICYSYEQTQEFLVWEPDMPLKKYVRIMNRARDLDEQGVPYHFVGTQLYVDGKLES